MAGPSGVRRKIHSFLTKVVKVVSVIVRKPRAPKIVNQSENRRAIGRRIVSHSRLGKRFGVPTRAPKARAIVAILQATFRRQIAKRIRTKSFFIRAIRSTIVNLQRFPFRPRTILAVLRRKDVGKHIRTKSLLTRVFGKLTRNAPVRRPRLALSRKFRLIVGRHTKSKSFFTRVFGAVFRKRPVQVYLAAKSRISVLRHTRTKSFLTRVVRVYFPIVTFPQRVKTYLQAKFRKQINPRVKTHSIFTRVFGKITRTPRPHTTIVSAAVVRASQRSRHVTRTQLRRAFGGLIVAINYVSYGGEFLFTRANWKGIAIYLEVYMRALSGVVYARLYDVTAGVEVTDSTINTSNLSFERIRSIALTLVDTHTYRIQVGRTSNSGEVMAGRIIILNS